MGRIWGARATSKAAKRRAALSRARSEGTTRRKPRSLPALRRLDWQTVDVPSMQEGQR